MGQIAVVTADKFLALSPQSKSIMDALAANLLPGETFSERDLCRVKVPPGGGTNWTIPGVGGDEQGKSIVGALVYYAGRGVVWPTAGDPVPGQLPILRTDDLVTAYQVGQDWGEIKPAALKSCETGPGKWSWKALTGVGGPLGFGSGKGGIGKRSREMRILGILRQGDTLPLIVFAGPGSLATITPFLKQLPVPHYAAVVELSLAKARGKRNIEYSQIVPKLVGTIPLDAAMKLKALYTDRLGAVVTSIGDGDGADEE